MCDVVSLGNVGDVLSEIGTFRGEDLEFTLASINNARSKHDLPRISEKSAIKAILSATYPEGEEEFVAHLLVQFFGRIEALPTFDSATDKDLDDPMIYVTKLDELRRNNSNIQGPVGPNLGCLFDGMPLGIYLYAKVLALRSRGADA